MKKYQTKIIIILCFLFVSINVSGQGFENFFRSRNIIDSNRYNINIKSTNFFKNNEFFGDFIAGYTLPGYGIKPKFVFLPYNNIKLKAGFYALKYFGTKKFSEIKPVFSIEYSPSKNIKIIFGEIYATTNHELPDQVFDYENFLTNNIENGMQILLDNKMLKADFWVNWKQFIIQNSTYPEIVEGGVSSKLILFKQTEQQNLSLELSGIACHTGGQIDTSDVPVETLANIISGIKYNNSVKKKLLKNICLSVNYIIAADLSPEKRLHYSNGYGILSGIELNSDSYDFKIMYWTARNFFSKSGNPIFQSISHRYADYYEDKRSLIVGNFFYQKKIYKEFKIGLGCDMFYDTRNKIFEYSFGFYMNADFNFF